MIQSMTGFGKGEQTAAGHNINFVVEISSVNRKQMEIRLSLPREFTGLEIELRQLIAAKISRGSLNVRLSVNADSAGSATAKINIELLKTLSQICVETKKEFNLDATGSVADLLRIPGVMSEDTLNPEQDDLHGAIVSATNMALNNLIAMRQAEGAALLKDIMGRLDFLKGLLTKIIPLTAEVQLMYKQRLLDKIAAEKLAISIDDERLLKEVLFYADKSDVSEEITRLQSHFAQFMDFISEDAPSGRSLDFLIQEMFREITTLGNKSGGGEITRMVVQFKAELEKIREQVQNIE